MVGLLDIVGVGIKLKIPRNIREQNEFPEQNPEDEPDGNLEGKVVRISVDFYRGIEGEFNDPSGLLSIYDPDNPDRMLMDSVEQESIELSTAPMLLYRLDRRNIIVDELYGEADATHGRKYLSPITIFLSYEDPSVVEELVSYGAFEREEIEVSGNMHYLANRIGRRILEGELLKTYDGKLWEVMNSLILDEALWKPIHNMLKVKRAQPENYKLPDVGNLTLSPNDIYSDQHRKVIIAPEETTDDLYGER